jgi:hypothetical protein
MVRLICSVALALSLGVPFNAEAEATGAPATGEVEGLVQIGKKPVPFANVIVIGTRRGAQADEHGRYHIVGVPAGQQTLRALAGNFRAMTGTVTIFPGQTVHFDFGIDEFNWKVPKGRTFELRVGVDCRTGSMAGRRVGTYHQMDSTNASGSFRLRCDIGEPWYLEAIYWLKHSEPSMKVVIVDDQGKTVRHLKTRGDKLSGMIRWDGLDDEGKECVWGDYLVRFVTAAGTLDFHCCLKWLTPYQPEPLQD